MAITMPTPPAEEVRRAKDGRRFIAALVRAHGGTQKEAAEAARCSEKSVTTWETHGDDLYDEYFTEHQRRLVPVARQRAMGTLLMALDHKDPVVRVRAASAILASLDRNLPQAVDVLHRQVVTFYQPEKDPDG